MARTVNFAPRRCLYCRDIYWPDGVLAKWCSLECRFWDKVDTSAGPDECWPWTGGLYVAGYGQISGALVPGGPRLHLYAHRLCLRFSGVEIPAGYYACHKCDNPRCCNPHPKHVYVGTPTDNAVDMYEHGRQGNRNYATGARHGNSRSRRLLTTTPSAGAP